MPEPRLGILAGSAFLEGFDLPGAARQVVRTSAGDVTAYGAAGCVLIRRHGEERYRPPHRIPHHAHVLALGLLGVTHAAGFASTGALRSTLQPGDIVVPDDYLSLHPPPTFAGDEYLHIVPGLDPDVRALLLRAARAAVRDARPATPVHDGGTYAQTHGPRFETRAEVRMLARDADVVGMTAASEATLCQERGIAYGMLCIVDNHANGVGPEPLTLDAFRTRLARNAAMAHRVVTEVIRLWQETP
jgi:5'-methylthioadenosine phosphorylase